MSGQLEIRREVARGRPDQKVGQTSREKSRRNGGELSRNTRPGGVPRFQRASWQRNYVNNKQVPRDGQCSVKMFRQEAGLRKVGDEPPVGKAAPFFRARKRSLQKSRRNAGALGVVRVAFVHYKKAIGIFASQLLASRAWPGGGCENREDRLCIEALAVVFRSRSLQAALLRLGGIGTEKEYPLFDDRAMFVDPQKKPGQVDSSEDQASANLETTASTH